MVRKNLPSSDVGTDFPSQGGQPVHLFCSEYIFKDHYGCCVEGGSHRIQMRGGGGLGQGVTGKMVVLATVHPCLPHPHGDPPPFWPTPSQPPLDSKCPATPTPKQL